MAHMIYQRLRTAILEAYTGHPEFAGHLVAAEACRAWLESIEIGSGLRDGLVEPVLVLEEAFRDLLPPRRQGSGSRPVD